MIQKGLSLKVKTIIAICLFVAIFIALVVVVSVNNGALDLAVSEKIVDLPDESYTHDAYVTHNVFAFFFEACGETAIYIFAALSMGILLWYCVKCIKIKPLNIIMAVACGILTVVAFWFYFKTFVGYVLDHIIGFKWDAADGFYPQITKSDVLTIKMLEVAAAIVCGTGMSFLFKGLKEETLKKLAKWIICFIIAAAVQTILIEIVKRPIGRMRYRAMNFFGDTAHSGFTPWYVVNGKRYGPDDNWLWSHLADTHDMYKSFPSGHTCAAGTTYCLMFLPFALGIKNKGIKALCIIAPICYTGLVAVSRIVAGAHYFSDVLFGGTIAFLLNVLVYEFLLCNRVHIKAMFGKTSISEEVEQESNLPEQDADNM